MHACVGVYVVVYYSRIVFVMFIVYTYPNSILESTPQNIFETAWVTCWRLKESLGKSQQFYQILLPTWLRGVV